MNGPVWEGVRVLVTGGGGFIGSHLVERLAGEGARLRAFVRYNARSDPGLLALLPQAIQGRLDVVGGDLRDPQAVLNAVEGCEVVFHLGALISIPYSYYHPHEVVDTNIMGTLNILNACRSAGVRRLVQASSSEVYGTARRVPIDENHPLQGQSPYSASKIGADKLVESYYRSFDLPVVTVRPFNTFGPRQSARAVIPTIITQALKLDAIELGSLDTRRDFTFVTDTVNGFILGAEAQGVEGMTFNLGAGQDITIGELADKIVQIVNRPVEIRQDPLRMRPEGSEVMRLLSDNRLARQHIGWEPQVSLQDGLVQTVSWVRENLDRYQIGNYQF